MEGAVEDRGPCREQALAYDGIPNIVVGTKHGGRNCLLLFSQSQVQHLLHNKPIKNICWMNEMRNWALSTVGLFMVYPACSDDLTPWLFWDKHLWQWPAASCHGPRGSITYHLLLAISLPDRIFIQVSGIAPSKQKGFFSERALFIWSALKMDWGIGINCFLED